MRGLASGCGGGGGGSVHLLRAPDNDMPMRTLIYHHCQSTVVVWEHVGGGVCLGMHECYIAGLAVVSVCRQVSLPPCWQHVA